MASSSRRRTVAPLFLVVVALSARPLAAYRAPDPDVIGADLVARVAESCDFRAAWRLFDSRSFSSAWLTHAGSAGETPMMAAARAGCGEVMALIILHPEFDHSTVKRLRQIRDLSAHAEKTWQGKESLVKWALCVVIGIRDARAFGQDELERDPRRAREDEIWFLPKPKEWLPPATLEEIGVTTPVEPAFPTEAYVAELEVSKVFHLIVDGMVEKLWSLMVTFLQSAPGSELSLSIARHVRSIGWFLFFHGGKQSMVKHSFCIDMLAKSPLVEYPPEEDPRHAHILAAGTTAIENYHHMGARLGALWNKTGTWVMFD